VVYYANDVKIGEAFSAPYGVSWSSNAAGNFAIKAEAVYTNGKTAFSSPITISIIEAASLSITSPVNNANFTFGQPVAIEAQATGGSSSVTKVEFFADTNFLGEDDAAPYSFSWNDAAVGTHILAVRAIYADGSNLQSTPVTITVSSLPVPVIASPVNNQGFTLGEAVLIAVNISAGNNNLSKIEFFADTQKLDEDAEAPFEFSWNGAALGSHILAARAVYVDSTIIQSTPVSITIYAPASIVITSPADNQTFVAGNPIQIVAEATPGAATISKIEFYAGGVKLGEDSNSPYEFAWSTANPGTYILTAKTVFTNAPSLESSPVTITITPVTSVEERFQLAGDYALSNAYPNPFNPSTVISFQLPVNSEVTLSIYNTNGQLVKRLVAGEMNAGRHSIVWDATDDRGLRVASGVYFYVIKAGDPSAGSGQGFTAQRKLVLMK
jgi:hypothetical protein